MTAPGSIPPSVQRVVDEIDARPLDLLCLADLAALVGTSPRSLQKSFRRHLGRTPMDYSREVRLAGAHGDLVAAGPGDGTSVTDVALRWGFNHPGRFAARHRATYGVSPGEALRTSTTFLVRG